MKCHICGKEIKGSKAYPGAKVSHMACAVKACAAIRAEVQAANPKRGVKMKATPWVVSLYDRVLDIVYYDADCDSDYVRRSLIEHDGYPSNIIVTRAP